MATQKNTSNTRISGGDWQSVPGLSQGLGSMMVSATKEWGSWGRSLAHMNVEALSLVARRAKAYAELPARLAACKQPQDLISLQMQFCTDCMRQYAESSRRVGQYMSEVQMLTGIDETLSDPEAADLNSTRANRDFITFPEPKADDLAAQRDGDAPERGSKQRSAA